MADWKTDARDCIEMREGRDWSFETDYFGLASIAYCLLFGKYIGTDKTSDGRHKIDAALKRVSAAPGGKKLTWTVLADRPLEQAL